VEPVNTGFAGHYPDRVSLDEQPGSLFAVKLIEPECTLTPAQGSAGIDTEFGGGLSNSPKHAGRMLLRAM
jgi:hypothetical protein